MAKEKKLRTADTARTLARPVLESMGLTLWDLRFEKEGVNWYLRYFIDKPGGVNFQDCESFSRAIDKLLDEADPIEQSYILEVGSPGIERALTRPEHFSFYLGHQIHIRLIRPREGVRDVFGTLTGHGQDGSVDIQTPEGALTIAKAEIAVVKLVANIDSGGKS